MTVITDHELATLASTCTTELIANHRNQFPKKGIWLHREEFENFVKSADNVQKFFDQMRIESSFGDHPKQPKVAKGIQSRLRKTEPIVDASESGASGAESDMTNGRLLKHALSMFMSLFAAVVNPVVLDPRIRPLKSSSLSPPRIRLITAHSRSKKRPT